MPETSTEPAPIPEKQELLFHEVLALFEQNTIAYAVAGAFALREHTGIYRDTKDLDVFLTPKNAELAFACLRKAGFQCQICDPRLVIQGAPR
ncbi:MAG TPA: hypothetical protein VEK33_13480 [Terriglobales bacterium]|nr:hypothetical protein [Terriglobales bacterium]